jgi:ABC-type uncharacterized transport system, permease component
MYGFSVHGLLVLYALSLLFYFSDFVSANRKMKRMGTGLLVFVWVLQTGWLVHRLLRLDDPSGLTRFETLFFFVWLLVTISIAASRLARIEPFVFAVNVVGFSVLAAVAAEGSSVSPLELWNAERYLLIAHISLALAAYALFTAGAVLSLMYLLLHRQLKSRNWNAVVRRMPSLETIDRYAFGAVLAGTPLLILSLAPAAATLFMARRAEWLADWKVFAALVAAVAYIIYIALRKRRMHPGLLTAQWNLYAFGALLANSLIGAASRFHSWS